MIETCSLQTLEEKNNVSLETQRLVQRDRNPTVNNMVKEKTVRTSRKETWMRIIVGIISGIIFWAWSYLIAVFFVINFVYGVFTGKRLRELAELTEIWNTQMYHFKKYMGFMTNTRPFPFTSLKESISKFE